jgi:hypothetical protein
MRRARLAPAALVLFLAACDYDVYGPGRRGMEGRYTLAGTVDGRFGHNVVGTIDIRHDRGSSAEVWIDWRYLDRIGTVLRIDTDYPARARVSRSGRIDFEFDGDIRIDGRRVWFTLRHDGRWDRGVIRGSWRLETDLPTTDRGSFTASRDGWW